LAGRQRFFTSADGVDWHRLETGVEHQIWDLAFDGYRYVAVGGDWNHGTWAEVLYSTDGRHWRAADVELVEPPRPTPSLLDNVVSDGSGFVALGGRTVANSEDGISWQQRTVFPDEPWIGPSALLWDGARYLAVTPVGSWISRDGLAWHGPHPIWPEPCWPWTSRMSLAYNGESYVTVAPGCGIASSSDGETWSVHAGHEARQTSVVWTGWQWVAVSLDGTLHTSPDGVVWTVEEVPWHPMPPPDADWQPVFRLAVGGGVTLAVGDGVTLTRRCAEWSSPRRPLGRVGSEAP
jgi:hypothetical protein